MSADRDQKQREWDDFSREIKPLGLDLVINKFGDQLANLFSDARIINASAIGMKFDQGWHIGTVISRCTKEEEMVARAKGIVGANFNTEFCNTVISLQLSRERLLFHLFTSSLFTLNLNIIIIVSSLLIY